MDNKINKDIIEITKDINGKIVAVKCEEFLVQQGEWLLNLFEEEQKKHDLIKDDSKIQVGFTIYTFKEENGKIKVLAPDYTKDPMKDTIENLSLSFIIHIQQNSILKKIDVQGEKIAFDDKIVILKEVRESSDIYLERAKEYEKGDSGWYIGVIENNRAKAPSYKDEYESIYAFEVLKFRPDFAQLLSLPKGYLIAIIDNEIKEITDGDDNVVYRKG